MDRYGIRGHANDFFKSYLKNRKQYTVTNGVESYIDDVKFGVPQGSVLGPLLFSLYINDIYRAVGQDYIRLFADDTALFMYDENLNSLIANVVSKFNELYLWCVRNKLTINCYKTNIILFHATNKPIPKQMDEIVTSDMTIKRVKSFQYLGLTLDETLRFNEHVECLGKSLIKYFGIFFSKIKYRVTNKLARELHHAFIYSRIKYGIEVYGNCCAKNINTIQVTQNKLLKLILHKDRRTPTDEINKTMNILKVKDIYECNVLHLSIISWWKCALVHLNYIFKKRQNNDDVRRKNQLVVPVVRLCLGERAVRVTGASLWNRLHKDMVQYRLMKCFKGKLKTYYISKYHMWCIDIWSCCVVIY